MQRRHLQEPAVEGLGVGIQRAAWLAHAMCGSGKGIALTLLFVESAHKDVRSGRSEAEGRPATEEPPK
jgi:hypothetical protein